MGEDRGVRRGFIYFFLFEGDKLQGESGGKKEWKRGEEAANKKRSSEYRGGSEQVRGNERESMILAFSTWCPESLSDSC